MKYIDGGVCAPRGFRAGGIHCGIRPNKNKNDLALIVSDVQCHTAGMFTQNQVKASPVLLDMKTVENGYATAIIANSGIANACAEDGDVNAERMQKACAVKLEIPQDEVLVCSTGVIGQRLNIEAIEAGLPQLMDALTGEASGSDNAATAIMTTDTRKKELACEIEIGGKTVKIGGISKGSGMIHPNMGTMLCFVTTDCSISRDLLKEALKEVCSKTFNRISVDGDTSTNDTLLILANGLAENKEITEKNEDYQLFKGALFQLCREIAQQMAADGEGAKHLITCKVMGAKDEQTAAALGKSVISSSLTKAAIFGNDANWGRVLAAMGYSGVTFDPSNVDISFASDGGTIEVCRNGCGLAFDEDLAEHILTKDEVEILITMKEGDGAAECWGCDLTYDYVKINGDYRT